MASTDAYGHSLALVDGDLVLANGAFATVSGLPNLVQALVLRVLAVVAGLVAGAVVAWLSAPGSEFATFARESVEEVKKVVWPTRKETMQTTAAVFAFVVVMAVFLWISDKTLEWVLYDIILGWKKT